MPAFQDIAKHLLRRSNKDGSAGTQEEQPRLVPFSSSDHFCLLLSIEMAFVT